MPRVQMFTSLAKYWERDPSIWCWFQDGSPTSRYFGKNRGKISVYAGREIDNAGDDFFVAFDGPARAIHCAVAIKKSLQTLQLGVRIGIHIGECEVIGEKLAAIAAMPSL